MVLTQAEMIALSSKVGRCAHKLERLRRAAMDPSEGMAILEAIDAVETELDAAVEQVEAE